MRVWLGGIAFSKECFLPNQVKVFDTTLRDGEQTPGVALTPEEKVKIAKQLDVLGVDVIEAGFPIASSGERDATRRVACAGLKAETCGLARTIKEDIDAALACNVDRIHLFIATSDVHLAKKLKLTRAQALAQTVDSIEYAKRHDVRVEFSAEDATRSDSSFLMQVLKAAAEAGAEILNIPDTVGVCVPRAMFNLIRKVKSAVDLPISVHCHDDMGLAVANSLAAIEAGASQVHATVNGIGERAGNASLEELALSLRTLYGVATNIRLKELWRTSQLVSKLTGVTVPPNKAVVGDNAFSHESGIHAHGVISSPDTYEPVPPEMVGRTRRLIAGKHAGSHGIDVMLQEMGFQLTSKQLREVLARVKELGDKGRKVTYKDLYALAEDLVGASPVEHEKIKLQDLVVVTGKNVTPKAKLTLLIEGKEYKSASKGVGPIDAVAKALQKSIGDAVKFRLVEFGLDAMSGGTDALAAVTVKLAGQNGRLVSARAVHEDIVMAGVAAILNAANKLYVKPARSGPRWL
jgi:2-isopropylmalate synthase